MSDLAPDHFPGHPPVRAPGNDSDGFERGNATLIEQWAAVEDAARVVALLAGQPAPEFEPRRERTGLQRQREAHRSRAEPQQRARRARQRAAANSARVSAARAIWVVASGQSRCSMASRTPGIVFTP